MWGKGIGRDGASASPETTTVTVTNSPSNVRAMALRLLLVLTLQGLLADSAALCASGARQNKLRVHLHKPERPACGLGLCRAGELVRLDHGARTLHACHCARPFCEHSSGHNSRACAWPCCAAPKVCGTQHGLLLADTTGVCCASASSQCARIQQLRRARSGSTRCSARCAVLGDRFLAVTQRYRGSLSVL